ncbi:putative ATP-dependent endonuclease of OLD family [Flavobacterium sp. CG_23.5]|jgi:predicted ATP-dependent endonuclease of OLD family|uniref:AAA family ATPase n=1 Tax=Flavobacterium sp. CG_23.5 TaxID=2760708 RepID=UPI001AEADF5C|nr:AAA family ATPase [Flavobacterium sp. CG_23.5]MBP2281745.1 putative ATP-dependent endonuclease of OLD family [Flavobacterium sp. CG_23.5]
MAMITLTQVTIDKYKSIQKKQVVEIDPAITTIVGMNEAGKTSFLTAIAKTNYFTVDSDFEFDMTQDYPRNELIDFQHGDEDSDIITCKYEISAELLKEIEDEFGVGVFTVKEFSYTVHYKAEANSFSGVTANLKKFLELEVEKYELSAETKEIIKKLSALDEVEKIVGIEADEDLPVFKKEVKKIIDGAYPKWGNDLAGYIGKKWIKAKMPKFWYFDDYYPLRGKININTLINQPPTNEKDKTSKALFELARIKPEDILNATEQEYEKYIALLEASSNKITAEIFKYWSTNKNLDIEFKIQNTTNIQGQPEKILDIRVKNQRHKITLPLDRRSKGFNWFFSFIIWFSKIQADKNSDYILLLDEPGLNLHASAQADLLGFFHDLSKKYQIIYTTHSPFMVETEHLDRVRTCFETEDGTIISDSIQEKDPNTLFPLQAALGYDIAQNLFVSKNNLLVEGPADLIYLTVISSLLEGEKRTFLNENITIVPVGGLDKVTTFISLLRGSKLNVGCLLDTFTDQKGKQKVEDLVMHKIIKDKNIRFFNEFTDNGKSVADIEDLFDKEEYLNLFNLAFDKEHPEIKLADLDTSLDTILKQINKVIKKSRFNHYRPANKLNQLGIDENYLKPATLDRFEKMFTEINKLF